MLFITIFFSKYRIDLGTANTIVLSKERNCFARAIGGGHSPRYRYILEVGEEAKSDDRAYPGNIVSYGP